MQKYNFSSPRLMRNFVASFKTVFVSRTVFAIGIAMEILFLAATPEKDCNEKPDPGNG